MKFIFLVVLISLCLVTDSLARHRRKKSQKSNSHKSVSLNHKSHSKSHKSKSRFSFSLSKRKYEAYLNRFREWPTKGISSPTNDWGNSATIYLDRHNIDCGIGALTGFHFQRDGESKFKYDYKCIMPKNCSAECEKKIQVIDQQKCKPLSTPQNDLGDENGKSTNYLDRHTVKCPTGTVLTQFKLNRVPPKIKYDYTCCEAKVTDCKSMTTKATDFGDYGTIYLDRQFVQVPDQANQAIVSFKLNSDYGTHTYSYSIDYCTVTG